MASKTEVCNLAISHLGIGKEIQDFETEKTSEAKTCRRFYDSALRRALRDFNWPFARRFFTLNLIESDPTTEWAYSYRYPSDAVMARRILSGTWPENNATLVPYLLAGDSSGRIIYSDQENAVLEYTTFVEDPAFYSSDFELAFSYLLAYYIAPRLTDVNFNLKEQMLTYYNLEIDSAMSNANNEEQDAREVESEFIRVRSGYADSGHEIKR